MFAAIRHLLLWASRRRRIQRAITAAPVTGALVRRFVAGEDTEDAVAATRALAARGLAISLDHLGEDTHDATTARAVRDAYRALLRRLETEGLTATAEVSMKLSALGQAIDPAMGLEHAREVCAAAAAAGVLVTVDMEDHTTTDRTLEAVSALRRDFPGTGAVLQASLRRSERDCCDLALPGSRVRLCKGAYQEPAAVAWQHPREVRSAYLRCLVSLVRGGAYTMAATHDPRLISAATAVFDSVPGGTPHEFQMLYGVRPGEETRLAAAGRRVRVYVPYGTEWYSYLMRRLAERPANLALVARAVFTPR